MKLNINTLTQEQKKQLSLGYKIYLNKDWKLVTEEPTSVTKEFIEYKFNKDTEILSRWISQEEKNTWDLKVIEATKVLNWETSEFITSLLKDWETETQLAEKILKNSKNYNLAYARIEQWKRNELAKL